MTETVGRCRLGRRIGKGGQASVYEAEHPKLGPVAVKLLDEQATEEAVARLMRECGALWAARNPNVVLVIDAGLDDERRAYLVMERLHGETVAGRLRRSGPVPIEEALRIAKAVLGGLQAAHAQGIVHRDIKPGNVFLERGGGVKILDFGVAALTDSGSDLTRDDVVIGSPRYAAPEQVTGDDVDPRTDLYAVGLLIYEMISGQPPFGRDGGTEENLLAHAERHPPQLSTLVSVPRALSALIASALSKDPSDRPPSAEEFARRLKRAVAPWRWKRWVGAALGASTVAVFGVVGFLRSRPPPVPTAPPAVMAAVPIVETAQAEPTEPPAPPMAANTSTHSAAPGSRPRKQRPPKSQPEPEKVTVDLSPAPTSP